MAFTLLGGGDHEGADWIISANATVAGRHYNIGRFAVNAGVTVTVAPYSGTAAHSSISDASAYAATAINAGALRVECDAAAVQGTINADQAGYGGGGGGGGGSGSTDEGFRDGTNDSSGCGTAGSGGAGTRGGSDGGGGENDTNGGASGAGGGPFGRSGIDATEDDSLALGSGGQGGRGGNGSNTRTALMTGVFDTGDLCCREGGGGGAGGPGGGAVEILAQSDLNVSGTIRCRGGGGAGDARSRTGGGNASDYGQGGDGGSAQPNPNAICTSPRAGADGTVGQGGGCLLWSRGLVGVTISGTIDLRDGDTSTARGGVLKIRSIPGSTTTTGGVVEVGRDHRTETLAPVPVQPSEGSIFDALVRDDGAADDVGLRWLQSFTAFVSDNARRSQFIASSNRANYPAIRPPSGTTTAVFFGFLNLQHIRDTVLANMRLIVANDATADIGSDAEGDYVIAFRQNAGTGLWQFPWSSDPGNDDPYNFPATQATLSAIKAVIDGGGQIDIAVFSSSTAAAQPGWSTAQLTYGGLPGADLEGAASAGIPDVAGALASVAPVSADLEGASSSGTPDVAGALASVAPVSADLEGTAASSTPDVAASLAVVHPAGVVLEGTVSFGTPEAVSALASVPPGSATLEGAASAGTPDVGGALAVVGVELSTANWDGSLYEPPIVLALLTAQVANSDITVDPIIAMGTDDLVVAADLTISQVERHSAGRVIRLRRTGASFSTYFDNEGSPLYPDAELFIVVEDASGNPVQIPFTIGPTGGGFNNWSINSISQATFIEAIATGDKFVLAIAEPRNWNLEGAASAATPDVAGALSSVAPAGINLEGAASSSTPDVSGALASVAPGSINLEGAASSNTPDVAGALASVPPVSANLEGVASAGTPAAAGSLASVAPGSVGLEGAASAGTPDVGGALAVAVPVTVDVEGIITAPAPQLSGELAVAVSVAVDLEGGVAAGTPDAAGFLSSLLKPDLEGIITASSPQLSGELAVVAVPPPVTTVAGAPTNLVVAAQLDSEVKLRWVAPATDGGSPLIGYQARVDTESWRPTETGTEATVRRLTNGQDYALSVRAINANGAGPPTAAAMATPSAVPRQPRPPSVSGSAVDTLTVTWAAPNDGGRALSRYEVQTRQSGFATWSAAIAVPAGTLTLDVDTLAAGTTYDVQVRAENANGWGKWSGVARGRTRAGTPSIARDPGDATIHWLARLDTFHFWSGSGDLDYDGETWRGAYGVVEVSETEQDISAPSQRVTVTVGIADNTLRAALLQDEGPVVVELRWIYSTDSGLTYVPLPRRFMGRLSRPTMSDGLYRAELETYDGDIDRGRPKYWSHETQIAEHPDDNGLEAMRALGAGIDVSWPP